MDFSVLLFNRIRIDKGINTRILMAIVTGFPKQFSGLFLSRLVLVFLNYLFFFWFYVTCFSLVQVWFVLVTLNYHLGLRDVMKSNLVIMVLFGWNVEG